MKLCSLLNVNMMRTIHDNKHYCMKFRSSAKPQNSDFLNSFWKKKTKVLMKVYPLKTTSEIKSEDTFSSCQLKIPNMKLAFENYFGKMEKPTARLVAKRGYFQNIQPCFYERLYLQSFSAKGYFQIKKVAYSPFFLSWKELVFLKVFFYLHQWRPFENVKRKRGGK